MAPVKHPTPWKFLAISGAIVGIWLLSTLAVIVSAIHFVFKYW